MAERVDEEKSLEVIRRMCSIGGGMLARQV